MEPKYIVAWKNESGRVCIHSDSETPARKKADELGDSLILCVCVKDLSEVMAELVFRA